MNHIHASNPFSILSQEEISHIHNATLDILENAGVRFLCDSALKIFRETGLRVDDEKKVYFPPDVVETCIRSVPSSFVRHPLNPTDHPLVRLGAGEVHFGTGSTTAYVVDLDGNYRTGTEEDIANFGRLSDAMPHLDIGNGMIWAQDVPSSVFHARYVEVLTKNCGKVQPAGDGLDQKTTDDIIRLVEILLGGREEIGRKKTFTMTVCPQKALTFDEEATVIIETAKVNLPNEICPMPLCGSMHPVTLAGAIAQGNAEFLSGAVLNQLVNAGAPMIYMIWPGMMDMAAATNVFGCPEQVLMCAAFAQIARHYQIPSNITVGQTDSKVPDQQAGYEKMMGILLAALAGADEIAVVGGLLDSGRVGNYEQLLIDDEIAGYVQRILGGIEVTDEKLGIDVILKVGPGGTFLEHGHTLKYFKEEQHLPRLSDRSVRQTWEAKGAKDIRKRANETARQILGEHRPLYLSDKTISELEKEVAAIYRREGQSYRPFPVSYNGLPRR